MQTEVLRVLRAEARSWWRHRELRRTGDYDQARQLERQAVSRDIEYLRAALNNPNAYVSCGGDACHTVSCRGRGRLHG